MLKTCYSLLLRCHPAAFRQCYEKEMLAIYDDVSAGGRVQGLFVDAVVSLFRQWVLRPEFRRPAPGEPLAVASGDIPLLASLDCYTPRPEAILVGCFLSAALLSFVVTASIRPGKAPSWLEHFHSFYTAVLTYPEPVAPTILSPVSRSWYRPPAEIGFRAATGRERILQYLRKCPNRDSQGYLECLPVSRSSLNEMAPNFLVRLGDEPQNPWLAVASVYFNLMPVLKSLDADGDLVISRWEISSAPSALRRLDLNRDGKLSPEECGFSLGPRSEDDPAFARYAQKVFMLTHPALAALDGDHDGEISAEEIRNSSRYLRTLDSNGDGFLTPNEVVPEQTAQQAADIFLRLDKDHDGRISMGERQSEEAQSLRGILLHADRNRDGAVTLADLTRELRVREESAAERERALKAASTGR
jgi:EF hand